MKDCIVRASAARGHIRAFAAYTRETVSEAQRRHQTSPVVTAALGRLLTAGAMMGVMMKGDDDVLTLKIEGNGPVGSLTVTADSKGRVKGYPRHALVDLPLKENGKLDVSGALGIGVLSVIRDVGLKEPYVGQTILVSGEIAEDLTYYYATSEQVPSSVGLGVLVAPDGHVMEAGGFIVQMMPDAQEADVAALEKALAGIPSVTKLLHEGKTPEDILRLLLDGLDPEFLETVPTQFYCNCSKRRVSKALISIGKDELTDMIESGEPAEVKCHFCNTAYTFSTAELEEIRDRARS